MSAVDAGVEAYLGRDALVLARAVTPSSGTSPNGLLEEFPNLLLAKFIIQRSQEVATYARRKLVDTVWTL